MNEPKLQEDLGVTDDRKAWETPELIVEDVRRVTRGGTGPDPNFAPPEERITRFYHS